MGHSCSCKLATHDFWDSHDFCFCCSCFLFYCTHDFWVSHVFISCSCVFLTRAAHDFWVFHVVICCSWVFVFLKKTAYSWLLSLSCFYFLLTFFLARLLMPFEFLMLSVVAHEFYGFIYKGYSWLLSFSCFCFLLTFLNKATHARFFLIVRLLMPFEFLMLSFVAHELFFFMKAAHDFWVSHVFISCSFF